jgi:hypothetical protein
VLVDLGWFVYFMWLLYCLIGFCAFLGCSRWRFSQWAVQSVGSSVSGRFSHWAVGWVICLLGGWLVGTRDIPLLLSSSNLVF